MGHFLDLKSKQEGLFDLLPTTMQITIAIMHSLLGQTLYQLLIILPNFIISL